jgi:hypothetical protein
MKQGLGTSVVQSYQAPFKTLALVRIAPRTALFIFHSAIFAASVGTPLLDILRLGLRGRR